MVGLAQQFWFDLNYFLTFWNKLYLKNIIRLFATINQRNSEILGKLQLNSFQFRNLYTQWDSRTNFGWIWMLPLMLSRKHFLKKDLAYLLLLTKEI